MLPGFKMAEMMASLQRVGFPPVSRLGLFQQPPLSDMRTLRHSQGQPLPVWATGGKECALAVEIGAVVQGRHRA